MTIHNRITEYFKIIKDFIEFKMPNPFKDYIYVRPVGTTDDALHIQEAINSAYTTGKIVLLGVGTFKLKTPIKVYSNSTLLGFGHGTVLNCVDDYNSTMIIGLNKPTDSVDNPTVVYNCTIKNIRLEGNNNPEQAIQGIKFYNSDADSGYKIVLDNIEFGGFDSESSWGIDITEHQSIAITNCYFSNCAKGILLHNCKNAIISNNAFEPNTTTPITITTNSDTVLLTANTYMPSLLSRKLNNTIVENSTRVYENNKLISET